MTAYRGEIWLANLNPTKKPDEVGKIRPVLIFQNDRLNESSYPTTIILPLTTSLIDSAQPLRYRVKAHQNLKENSDILISQIRSIDNIRLIEKISKLTSKQMSEIKELLDEVLLNF